MNLQRTQYELYFVCIVYGLEFSQKIEQCIISICLSIGKTLLVIIQGI